MTKPSVGKSNRRAVTSKRRRGSLAAYMVLTIIAVFAVFPLLWMVFSSLKRSRDLYRFPPTWFTKSLNVDFYRRVLDGTPFKQWVVNSLIVSLISTFIVVVFSAMAAYGLVRGRYRGRNAMSQATLIAYVFPTILLVIPLFVVISKLGLANSYTGLIIVYVAFNFPFCTWLMISYFRTLPLEIEEAGRVDGLTNLGVLVRLVVPLSGPGLATTAIFGFINSWNEFLLAFVILGGGSKRTLPVGVYSYVGSEVADWGPLMAATTLTILPTLLLFLFAQRRIVGGLTGGAVKG
jgi:multiple sugar transport system permease protein